MRSAHPLLRGLAGVLSCALVSLPLATSLHSAEAAHIACPEHGELLEADASAAAQGQSNATDDAAVQSVPAAVEHGHVHCALLAQAHQRALAGAAAPASFASDLHAEPSVRLVSTETTAAIALIRLAPKSSPPARG